MKLIDRVLQLRSAYTKEELMNTYCPTELYLFNKVKFRGFCDDTEETCISICEDCWNQEIEDGEEQA